MTSPASFNSPQRIIEYAMKDAGLLQRGDLPDSDQYAEYGDRLLDVINFEQTQGLKVWTQVDLPVTLTAGVGTYTFGPAGSVAMTKPLRVLQAYTLNIGGAKRPLVPISRDEYSRLSNTSQLGAINSYFVQKNQLTMDVTFWLIPDATAATDVAHLIIQEQITNFTTLNEGVNFPVEWFMFLRWALSNDICTGQPQAIMDRCAKMYMFYKDAIEDWDVEDASTFFQVDNRGITNQRGGFR